MGLYGAWRSPPAARPLDSPDELLGWTPGHSNDPCRASVTLRPQVTSHRPQCDTSACPPPPPARANTWHRPLLPPLPGHPSRSACVPHYLCCCCCRREAVRGGAGRGCWRATTWREGTAMTAFVRAAPTPTSTACAAGTPWTPSATSATAWSPSRRPAGSTQRTPTVCRCWGPSSQSGRRARLRARACLAAQRRQKRLPRGWRPSRGTMGLKAGWSTLRMRWSASTSRTCCTSCGA